MSEHNKQEQEEQLEMEQAGEGRSAGFISRRKLLLSMGVAGAAVLATGGMAFGAESFKEKEKNDKDKDKDKGKGKNNHNSNSPNSENTNNEEDCCESKIEQIPDIATLRVTAGSFDGQQVYVTSHSSDWVSSPILGRGPTGGGMFTRIAVSDLVSPVDNNGSIIIVDSNIAWIRSDTSECHVENFGALPDGVTNNSVAILAAIASIRANPVSILQEIGGSTITAYTSGRVLFGRGVYVVSPDVLSITQDMGLQLVGQGYRGTNNAIRGTTTLLISGTSSGFGIRYYGSGSRSGLIQDMDICYASENFTGDLIDSYSSPGLKLSRVFIGTFGLTANTRLHSARSGIRATYDEFNHFENVTFDGLQDGWWSDDLRDTNPFGGTLTSFDTCVFYDVTGSMIRHDGNRTRNALSIKSTAFNPIQVSCQRAIKVDNIDGIHVDTCVLAGSTVHKAEVEWVKITNATGSIASTSFNDFSKAGTLGGMLEVTGNIVYCTDGFTLNGGPIRASNNEFSKASAGYRVSPLYPLAMQLGPDLFKADVNVSYYITPDAVDLSGKIIYAPEQDASVNKFINEGTRVTITSSSGHTVSIGSASYSISILHTGRDFAYSVNGSQSFELPVPVVGTEIGLMVVGTGRKTITTPSGVSIIAGTGSAFTSLYSEAPGSYIRFRAFGVSTWVVISKTDGWVI
ncbi:glycosyl hydrolase family 28-related protein [Paenibacillus eucommiae]|uniref:Rhamnogalacturonase A/B/Epimerase-like pectate lyase domain-containing protein n=1 Tax=Paenibacillus eucommiae TaxID=1355755 RepID=A0ABS4J5F0_9BACL|nr:glycosyl hydrolase family 28-related protein [Paenibacillus eucommiae]MBP1995062.1 hypothetical protein [Paenibacillus eucommiae]